MPCLDQIQSSSFWPPSASLLIVNGKVIHSETERIIDQVYATTLTLDSGAATAM